MTTDVVPFDFEGQPVRSIGTPDAPLFVAADVARILGYRDAANMCRRIDDEDRGTHSVSTPSGDQDMTVLTESGLYAAILASKLPSAKRFKRWITAEVLPAIRRTGSYSAKPMTRVELLAAAVIEATTAIAEKDARIAELEPKAQTFDTFLNSTGDYSVNEAAKTLSRDDGILTGERRLFQFMQRIGWIYRDGAGRPIPYQAQVDNGRLVAKPQFHYHPQTGETVADPPQIRVTAKGLDALRRKYLDASLPAVAQNPA